MPSEGNASTGGKNRNSKMQSSLQRTAAPDGLEADQLRLLGLPNLSIILDNTGGAGAATILVEVTTEQNNWVALPLLTVGAGLSGYAQWTTAARVARVTIGGGEAPNYLLSASA